MQQSQSNTGSTTDNSPSRGGSINSKGGRRPRGRSSHRADCCKPVLTTASCACPRNTFSITVTAVQRAVSRGPAAQLHLPGRGQSTLSRETHHQISLQQHYSGSNAIIYGHIQASKCRVIRLGHLELRCNSTHGHDAHGHTPTEVSTQDTNDMVPQNGKFSDRRQRRTLGVLSPHSKPCHMGNLAALLGKRDWTTCPGDARLQHWHQHHRVHQKEPDPPGKSQGRDLWPHHHPHLT